MNRFFICHHCGNLVGILHTAGVPILCCGEKMHELVPNTTDAAGEKHLPVARVEGDKVHVKVGSVPHPMTEDHSIEWVYLETSIGGQRKTLGDKPEICFALCDGEKPKAVYAWCNLHGLWKTEL